jgi:hypothetical protein
VFLNSPFLEFNAPWLTRRGLAPLVNLLGRLSPKSGIGQELGTVYGSTIHADYEGEWHYDLNWKPLNGYKIHAVLGARDHQGPPPSPARDSPSTCRSWSPRQPAVT